MKNLLVILLVAAGVGLFFHDKQQTADLAKAQDDVTQLSKQLDDSEAQANGLKLKVQQLTAELVKAEAASQAPPVAGPPAAPAAQPSPGTWGLKGSGELDRPAYRSH